MTGFMVPRVLSWILEWGKLGISQEVGQVNPHSLSGCTAHADRDGHPSPSLHLFSLKVTLPEALCHSEKAKEEETLPGMLCVCAVPGVLPCWATPSLFWDLRPLWASIAYVYNFDLVNCTQLLPS